MRVATLIAPALLLLLSACTYEVQRPEQRFHWQLALLEPGELPDASVGRYYDVPLTYSVKNIEPYQWAVSAGTLPPGLSLQSSNNRHSRLYGTPTQTGVFPISLEITGSVGPVTFDRVIRVFPADTLLVTTVSLDPAAVGANYGVNVEAVDGSGAGYYWDLEHGSLPPGLTLDHRDDTLTWGAFAGTGDLDQSLGNGELSRVSGMAASASQPGVFWVHDDTTAPMLYAVNAQGDVLQQYQLQTSAVRWEDISMGPGPGFDYIYIGDFGDPTSSRDDCRVLRVSEPTVPVSPTWIQPLAPEEFWFTYPGGAQDCATLLFDYDTGTPYLVERTGSVSPRVHKFPMPLDTAWDAYNPVGLSQVTAAGTFAPDITGGDGSRDGRRVVLRNRSNAFEYALPTGQGFDAIFDLAGQAVNVPGGQEHEAIAYGGKGATLWTTTELGTQATAPIHRSDAQPDNGYTTISGIPTSAGVWTFGLRVTDSAGNTASRTFTISVQ